MNKIINSVSLLIALSATGVQAQNLLIHYEFNNPNTSTTMATDSSGNGRHANITNWNGSAQVAAPLQTAVGVSGLPGDYAFDNTGAPGMGGFDIRGGVVRWVGTENVDMINNLRALTISYWFKTPEGVTAGGGARAVSLYGDSNQHYFENRFATVSSVDGYAQTVVTGSSLRTSATAAYDQSDTWTFVAFTFDGMAAADERIKMYVGGIDTPLTLVGTFNSTLVSINVSTSDNSLTLGGLNSGSGQTPFQAIMDDFRLYGNGGNTSESALSLEQLEAVRISAIPEPQTTALLMAIGVCLVGVFFKSRKKSE
jgi:hypothetical protein